MLSNKTIKGKTVEEYVEMCFNIAKWIEVFNSNGEDIYGDDYEAVLLVLGIANAGMARPLNEFVDVAEKYAGKRNLDLLKQFNIKLEGDDTNDKLKN